MVIFPQKTHWCESGVGGQMRGMEEEAKVPGKRKRENLKGELKGEFKFGEKVKVLNIFRDQ